LTSVTTEAGFGEHRANLFLKKGFGRIIRTEQAQANRHVAQANSSNPTAADETGHEILWSVPVMAESVKRATDNQPALAGSMTHDP